MYVIYIYVFNITSSCNATCVYIFRADHLAQDSQLLSSLRKTTHPSSNFPQLPIVLYVGLSCLCRAASLKNKFCTMLGYSEISKTETAEINHADDTFMCNLYQVCSTFKGM